MKEITFQNGLESLTDSGSIAKAKQIQSPESFGDMLERSLKEVNQLKLEADEAINNLAAGEQKDIHQTMIDLEKADVAFQLLMQVRNKIISAYQTLMRMPV
ncbi:MAG: flagellar hook-basal body complex protein FliE [Desulfobacterales bacterium]|jgi:flagellar hook-basal body complex protein FliE